MCTHWSNLTVVFFVLLSILVYSVRATHDKSVLHFKTFSAEHVTGCYVFNESLGLCFDIRPDHILLTKKRNGENFVLFNDIGRKTFHFRILDHSFVGQNSSLRLVSRDKPHLLRANSLSSGVFTNSWEPGKYLPEIAEKLNKTPESLLLEDLSSALARNTSSFQTLHCLYLMSIGLSHITKRNPQLSYKKTQWQKTAFDRSGSCQDLSSDPNKNRCLGMCGPGCTCWKFVCKDCCFHEGCRQHDICCRHKAFSIFCLTPFIYGFTCNGFAGYPKCLH